MFLRATFIAAVMVVYPHNHRVPPLCAGMAAGNPAGPQNPNWISGRPQPERQPKDRAELAGRAQARQPAPDQSAHPYRSQTCQ